MCTLIVNPRKAQVISLDNFNNLWDNNPDGAGFAYVRGNRVEIVKEMSSAAELWRKYIDIRNSTPHPIILHFRISTQGRVNEANAHPFRVHEALAFAHNGVITTAPYDKNHSDTALLVRDVLAKWPKDFINRKGYPEALKYIAGGSNKFALLNGSGQTLIINPHLFHEHEGSLYSNQGYKPAVYCSPVTYGRYYDTTGKAIGNRIGTRATEPEDYRKWWQK